MKVANIRYSSEAADDKGNYIHAPHQYRSHAGDKPCKIYIRLTLDGAEEADGAGKVEDKRRPVSR